MDKERSNSSTVGILTRRLINAAGELMGVYNEQVNESFMQPNRRHNDSIYSGVLLWGKYHTRVDNVGAMTSQSPDREISSVALNIGHTVQHRCALPLLPRVAPPCEEHAHRSPDHGRSQSLHRLSHGRPALAMLSLIPFQY